jgi:hypothetical protein
VNGRRNYDKPDLEPAADAIVMEVEDDAEGPATSTGGMIADDYDILLEMTSTLTNTDRTCPSQT